VHSGFLDGPGRASIVQLLDFCSISVLQVPIIVLTLHVIFLHVLHASFASFIMFLVNFCESFFIDSSKRLDKRPETREQT
jgi:hypothetical protein